MLWLKPIKFNKKQLESLINSKFGLVVDTSYEICGATRSIAYDLSILTNSKVYALGASDNIPGAAVRLENCGPTAKKISTKIIQILKKT